MSATGFDPWRTYYESPAEQAAIKQRAKYRDAMKEEYRKIKSNPFKPPQGVIHDPNMQRWFSARVTYAEYLKPSKRGTLITACVFGFFTLLYCGIAYRRDRKFDEIANGELDYRTRALMFNPR
uniref:NADH dehydrogenase [ubiquinone] 1 beta subcomplex subunit 4 n=1 Tax=Mesocestoides corti TaxID=53468 RepID=A0A5K3EVS8_MESCO